MASARLATLQVGLKCQRALMGSQLLIGLQPEALLRMAAQLEPLLAYLPAVLPALLYTASGIAAGAAMLAFLRPNKAVEAFAPVAEPSAARDGQSLPLLSNPTKLDRRSSDAPSSPGR